MAMPATTAPPATAVTRAAWLTHHDVLYGFSFEYPADWMLEAIELGDRALAAYQLTSWKQEPGAVAEVREGATIMTITLQLWEPNGELDAYGKQRTSAWRASGLTIVDEMEVMLLNGSRALTGVIQEPGEGHGYFLLTTLGDHYLTATGDGDVQAMRLIAVSIR
jgi:hypothetical protein